LYRKKACIGQNANFLYLKTIQHCNAFATAGRAFGNFFVKNCNIQPSEDYCFRITEAFKLACSAPFGLQPRCATGFRQITHPEDVALPLGHGDNAARIQQIEHVRSFDALVVSG
jgi:hypothetical protein